jgi:hypothetical protein
MSKHLTPSDIEIMRKALEWRLSLTYTMLESPIVKQEDVNLSFKLHKALIHNITSRILQTIKDTL